MAVPRLRAPIAVIRYGEEEALVIWRSAILACYPVLAVVVGAGYGAQGLTILLFFYFSVAAWAAFMLAWGSLARRAGEWNWERVRRTGRLPFARASSTS